MDQNDRWSPSTPNNLSDAPGQEVTKAQIAMRHPVGERLQLKIGTVVAYGFFAELEPGFDALCHQNHIRGLNGRSPQEVFTTGQLVECRVHSVNFGVGGVRVQLACDVPPASEMASMSPLVASLREIEQWVVAHPSQVRELVSGLKAAVQEMPNTRRLFRSFFKSQITRPMGPASPWGAMVSQVLETEALPMQEGPSAMQDRVERILVDGSNFIRASIGAKGLEAILAALKGSGRSPLVVFDAATPWRVDEDGKALIERLVDAGEATIVPGGSQADDYLLLMASKNGGEIVSNDLFRDYLDRYPWLAGDGKSGKRVHSALVADGMVLIPDLGICSSVG